VDTAVPGGTGAASVATDSNGVKTGAMDFSEFSVQATLPTGLSYIGDNGGQTMGVGNDATEGNYVYMTMTAFQSSGISFDAFDSVITDKQNSSLEMLARIWVPGTYVDNRRLGGPNGFMGGTSEATLDFLGADVYMRTSGTTDIESGVLQLINNVGGVVNGDIQEADQLGVWMWVRVRIVDEGATDAQYVKAWYGALANEPAGWDYSNTGVSKRDHTNLGDKIGWGVAQQNYRENSESMKCAFLSFSYAPSGETLTSPPSSVPTVFTAVGGQLIHSGAPEIGDLKAQGSQLELYGVDQTVINLIQANNFRGRPLRIYLVHFDPDTGVQDTPDLIFVGRQNGDFTVIEDRQHDNPSGSGGTVTVSTRITADIASVNTKVSTRSNVTSHEEMLRRSGVASPDDKFFKRVITLQNKDIYWGRFAPNVRGTIGADEFDRGSDDSDGGEGRIW
jgi:hypothetical protein